MSSEEREGDRADSVAAVATSLFGAQIEADAVIDESLKRATDPALRINNIGAALRAAIDAELPSALDDDTLRHHPLAVWIELRLGLRDEQKLTRQPPTSIGEAARRLSEESGKARINLPRQNSIDADAYEPPRERAWRQVAKAHFLLSNCIALFLELETHFQRFVKSGSRRVSLDGQRYEPEDPELASMRHSSVAAVDKSFTRLR